MAIACEKLLIVASAPESTHQNEKYTTLRVAVGWERKREKNQILL